MASADKARLKAAAKARGVTLSKLVEELLDAGVAEAELNFNSAKAPDALAESMVDAAIVASGAAPSPAPVNYGSKAKVARRKAKQSAPDARKKSL